MKHGQSMHKAGKLIKIKLEYNGKIHGIRITGDFFMYPEEKIGDLEKALVGVDTEKQSLCKKITEFIENEKVQVFGFDPESLTEAILKAVEQ